MSMRRSNYEAERTKMMPGDILAFGGKSLISGAIKLGTLSAVSHIAVVMQTRLLDKDSGRYFNMLIESTGEKGVATAMARQVVQSYEGDVWWLPLDRKKRQAQFKPKRFFDFLLKQEGKGYDVPQAIKSALDGPLELMHAQEDFNRFFCSELAAGALEAGRMTSELNASEVTPIDLCRWAIYESEYVQLKGRSREIKRYNRMDPALWRE